MTVATGFHPTTADQETSEVGETTQIRTIGTARNAATTILLSGMNATAVELHVQTVGDAKMDGPTEGNGQVAENAQGVATTTVTTTGNVVSAATPTLLSDKSATCAALRDQGAVLHLMEANTVANEGTPEVQTAEGMTEVDATTAHSPTTTGIAMNAAIPTFPFVKNATAARHLDRGGEGAKEAGPTIGIEAVGTDRNGELRTDTTTAEAMATGHNVNLKIVLTETEGTAGGLVAGPGGPNEVPPVGRMAEGQSIVEPKTDPAEQVDATSVLVMIRSAAHGENAPVTHTTDHHGISESPDRFSERTRIDTRRR